MAKLKIKFEGLICHVGNANIKTHAVLVHEPSAHTPQIRSGGSVLTLRQWDTVTFEGPNAGVAAVGPTVTTRVPMLSRTIKNGGIFQTILDQKHAQASVVAYVVFPAGTLDAPQPHRRKLTLTLGTATPVTQCIAAGVTFTSDEFRDGDITIAITHHDDQGNIINVDRFPHNPANDIIVENVSGAGNHFHEYLRLTSANVIARADAAEDCPEAETAEILFTSKLQREQETVSAGAARATFVAEANVLHTLSASVNPECTNSQWP